MGLRVRGSDRLLVWATDGLKEVSEARHGVQRTEWDAKAWLLAGRTGHEALPIFPELSSLILNLLSPLAPNSSLSRLTNLKASVSVRGQFSSRYVAIDRKVVRPAPPPRDKASQRARTQANVVAPSCVRIAPVNHLLWVVTPDPTTVRTHPLYHPRPESP